MQLPVIGIMNGTSLDGVDFVSTLVSKSGRKLSLVYEDMASLPFPSKLKAKLAKATQHSLKVDELAELHFDLGRFYAQSLQKILHGKKWKPQLIGLHGQTVYHRGGFASLQIGEPSFLSAALKIPVVSDFRPGDLAKGGQGAPLAPIFHRVAFANKKKNIAVHNLGGISNLTYFEKGQIATAFDTGPANMPMDLIVQTLTKGQKNFDTGGRLARSGKVDPAILAKLLRHPYFKKKAPKSCGREEFGQIWLGPFLPNLDSESAKDLLATVTEAVALSIAQAYRRQTPGVPAEILFCGGGSQNSFLLERIQSQLPESQVLTTEDRGWPSQAIEGAAFALLAAARFWNLPLDLASSTGAQGPARLGKITSL